MTTPFAVIDIGSNSVRLVIYDALSRAPLSLFNEKVSCGLGRALASTGKMDKDAMDEALEALKRYRRLLDALPGAHVHVLATAAVRDAENGPHFIEKARAICGKVDLVSGPREAELTALGVVAGFFEPRGIAGDLGGGSLELIGIDKQALHAGVTLPLGGLRLQDAADNDLSKAEKLIDKALKEVDATALQGLPLKNMPFYAIGGTWRALARLHMRGKNYPLRVTHGYTLDIKEALRFLRDVQKVSFKKQGETSERKALAVYGALILEKLIKALKPERIIFSTQGVREGLAYSLLSSRLQAQDALLYGAARHGSPPLPLRSYAQDLQLWCDGFYKDLNPHETTSQKRLRHAACLASETAWDAHADYRAEQGFYSLAHAPFIAVNHDERLWIALSVYHRYEGGRSGRLDPTYMNVLTAAQKKQAQILGTALRLAYAFSASTPGVLACTRLTVNDRSITLHVQAREKNRVLKNVKNRLARLANLLGRESRIAILS